MDQPPGSGSYVFIVSSSDAGVPAGRESRRLIRKQAMEKVAAARRKTGTWGQHNRRQYPISQLDLEKQAEAEREAATPTSARPDLNHQQQGLIQMFEARTAVPPSLASSGYEAMRSKFGFDLLDVSALTTFHTGRITAQLLFREPLRLATILRYCQWSYFSFLPSRYGYSACLDDATHCLAARLRQWVITPGASPSDGVLSLYSKCLTSLQKALNDPDLCLKPEILCATAILGIYEVNRLPIPWTWRSLIGPALGQCR